MKMHRYLRVLEFGYLWVYRVTKYRFSSGLPVELFVLPFFPLGKEFFFFVSLLYIIRYNLSTTWAFLFKLSEFSDELWNFEAVERGCRGCGSLFFCAVGSGLGRQVIPFSASVQQRGSYFVIKSIFCCLCQRPNEAHLVQRQQTCLRWQDFAASEKFAQKRWWLFPCEILIQLTSQPSAPQMPA